MFTIMHLSDLHRSRNDSISNDELLSAIISDIDRFGHETPQISKPNAIVITGDIVQGLKVDSSDYPHLLEKQYDEAYNFCEMLSKEIFSGDRSKIVILPGNHDVDWNKTRQEMIRIDPMPSEISKLLFAPQSDYRWSWESLQLFKIQDPKAYENKLLFFRNFINRFYRSTNISDNFVPDRDWNIFPFDDSRIILATHNSCIASDCFNNLGEISNDSLAQCHMEIRKSYSPKLIIAAWHHDIQGPPRRNDYMDVDTVKLMISQGYRLGLHGHQHKSEVTPCTLLNEDNQKMIVISAGSLCAGSSDLPTGFKRQYNLIEISPDYKSARIHVREMHIRDVFGQGRLPSLGSKSYIDTSWDPPPTSICFSTASSYARLNLIEKVEKAYFSGEYPEVIELIINNSGVLGEYGKKLLINSLFKTESWIDLVKFISDPQTIEEFGYLLKACTALKDWSLGEKIIKSATTNSMFDQKIIREFSNRFNVERKLLK